jgi:cyclopropane fatty-acyl-phospholipid synthase-like methyltransferase
MTTSTPISPTPTPVPEEVGKLYDRYTALGAASLGQDLHFGYWDPEDADVPFDEATGLLTDLMAGRLRLRPGDRVLDLGCGVGTPGVRIATAHDVSLTGISVSGEQVTRANNLAAAHGVADRVRFEQHDAMRLGFADASFDAVIALESIIHMPDRGRVLAQVARVLKPGGRMVLTDFHERSPIPQPGRAAVDRYLRDFMMTTVDPAEYPRIARDAGLWLSEITDISDHTLRRTFVELSHRLRSGREALGREHDTELIDAFDPGDLVDVPEFGYLLVVLRKPL